MSGNRVLFAVLFALFSAALCVSVRAPLNATSSRSVVQGIDSATIVQSSKLLVPSVESSTYSLLPSIESNGETLGVTVRRRRSLSPKARCLKRCSKGKRGRSCRRKCTRKGKGRGRGPGRLSPKARCLKRCPKGKRGWSCRRKCRGRGKVRVGRGRGRLSPKERCLRRCRKGHRGRTCRRKCIGKGRGRGRRRERLSPKARCLRRCSKGKRGWYCRRKCRGRGKVRVRHRGGRRQAGRRAAARAARLARRMRARRRRAKLRRLAAERRAVARANARAAREREERASRLDRSRMAAKIAAAKAALLRSKRDALIAERRRIQRDLEEKRQSKLRMIKKDLASGSSRTKKAFPEWCYCKKQYTNANSLCYYFTPNGAPNSCQARQCRMGYQCVDNNTGMYCIRKRRTEKVVPTGVGKCETVKYEHFTYVPYGGYSYL